MAPEARNVKSLFEEILPDIFAQGPVDYGKFTNKVRSKRYRCQFVFTGDAGGSWAMEIAPETVTISAEETESDCKVSMAADLIGRSKKLNRRTVIWLLAKRAIRVEGDMQVLKLALFVLFGAIKKHREQRSSETAAETVQNGPVPEILFCVSRQGSGCWDDSADDLEERLKGQRFQIVRQAAIPCNKLLRAHSEQPPTNKMFSEKPRIVILDLLADLVRFTDDGGGSRVNPCHKALRAVVNALHDSGSRVVIANLFAHAPNEPKALRRELNALNSMLMELSRETGVCIADVNAAVANQGSDFVQADYLLGTPAAATLTAEALADCLNSETVLDEFNEQRQAENK